MFLPSNNHFYRWVMLLVLVGMITFSEAQIVQLTWSPNNEEDLAYYVIYRDTIPNPRIEIARVFPPDSFYQDQNVAEGITYFYQVCTIDSALNQSPLSKEMQVYIEPVETSVNGVHPVKPDQFNLEPNYPNPFNPRTMIAYSVAQSGPILLQIYDIQGRLVKTLVNASQPAGFYNLPWDGTDNAFRPVSSGLYLYRLTGNSQQITRKLMVMK